MFDIDINKIFRRFMPHFLRKPVMLDYLASAAKAIKDVNINFVALRDAVLLKLSFTGQTIYLEKLLNDNYDPVLRRIYIDNTNIQNYIYWRNVIESAPPFYLFNDSEVSAPVYLSNYSEVEASIHFIVNIPVAVTFDPIDVNADVRRYAQAGKTWIIETF